MVHFLIKRYFHALKSYRLWLAISLAPVLIFFLYTAMRPDYFVVSRDMVIARDAPVALSSPVGYTTMNEIIKRQADFLSERYAVMELYMQINGGAPGDRDNQRYGILMEMIAKHLELTMAEEGSARITYRGSDRSIGEKMVGFYAARLFEKAQSGLKRIKAEQEKSQSPLAGQPADEGKQITRNLPASVSPPGAIQISPVRALWRPERTLPAVSIFILSFLLILILIGIREWTDPSFKSERQVARYLGLPVLGAMPDLNFICNSFGIKDTAKTS